MAGAESRAFIAGAESLGIMAGAESRAFIAGAESRAFMAGAESRSFMADARIIFDAEVAVCFHGEERMSRLAVEMARWAQLAKDMVVMV